MLSTFITVLPVFGLILAGWLARKARFLGLHAVSEINRFVVYLALPALLFDIIANARASAIWQPGFIAAFGLGCAATYVLGLLLRRRHRPLADAAIVGLDAGYSNTGYLGFPLVAVAFGPAAQPLTTLATLITVCALFAAAIVLVEIGQQARQNPLRLAAKVGLALIRNPLILAPIAGALFSATGLAVPPSAETFLKLLGGAASPCALVALGLFLAEARPSARGERVFTGTLVVLKLIIQPAVTWVLAAEVMRLPSIATDTAVLLAALPTGTGPFMLAELYGREAAITSDVILVSTVLSIFTLSLFLATGHLG